MVRRPTGRRQPYSRAYACMNVCSIVNSSSSQNNHTRAAAADSKPHAPHSFLANGISETAQWHDFAQALLWLVGFYSKHGKFSRNGSLLHWCPSYPSLFVTPLTARPSSSFHPYLELFSRGSRRKFNTHPDGRPMNECTTVCWRAGSAGNHQASTSRKCQDQP